MRDIQEYGSDSDGSSLDDDNSSGADGADGDGVANTSAPALADIGGGGGLALDPDDTAIADMHVASDEGGFLNDDSSDAAFDGGVANTSAPALANIGGSTAAADSDHGNNGNRYGTAPEDIVCAAGRAVSEVLRLRNACKWQWSRSTHRHAKSS